MNPNVEYLYRMQALYVYICMYVCLIVRISSWFENRKRQTTEMIYEWNLTSSPRMLWLIKQTMNLFIIRHLICIYNNLPIIYFYFLSILFSKSIIFCVFNLNNFFALHLLYIDRSITWLYAKIFIEWYSYSTSIARFYVYNISWHLNMRKKTEN